MAITPIDPTVTPPESATSAGAGFDLPRTWLQESSVELPGSYKEMVGGESNESGSYTVPVVHNRNWGSGIPGAGGFGVQSSGAGSGGGLSTNPFYANSNIKILP